MTDQDLLTEMQLALLEPPDGGQSWPSEAFTKDEAIDALNSSVRYLVRDTHLIVSRAEIAVTSGATSVTLPADWMATLDAVWRTAQNVRTPIGSVDAYESDLGQPTWMVTPGTPLCYLDLDQASMTVRLAPVPDVDGVLELLYAPRPTELNGNGVTVSLPQDYLYGAKWGALGTMLRKVGRMHDPERATYCDKRIDLTTMLAEIILTGWA